MYTYYLIISPLTLYPHLETLDSLAALISQKTDSFKFSL